MDPCGYLWGWVGFRGENGRSIANAARCAMAAARTSSTASSTRSPSASAAAAAVLGRRHVVGPERAAGELPADVVDE